jgi:hypothetical protein
MLEGLFSSLTNPVPPVPPAKNKREPLESADLLAVPLVPRVPREKTKTKAENTNPTEPRPETDDDRHPDRIGPSASDAKPEPAPAADPLLVTVYTPSGTAMTTRAANAEHAAWLRQMNPKSANPAPKPSPTPEPDADRISEAEHTAQGRFFKFLVTRPDGSQYYSCSMPRMALSEVRAQYPEAANIQSSDDDVYCDEQLADEVDSKSP